jgi:putative hydrolase of the HAD superfamily
LTRAQRELGNALPPRAVLFDLDDTLIDRPATVRVFTERLVSDFGEELPPCDLASLSCLVQLADRGGYRTREELARGLVGGLPWRTPPTPERLADYWAKNFGRCSTASAEAVPLVRRLRARGIKTGIVTNGPPSQHVKIDALGVRSLVDVIVVSDEVGCRKPDPAIFRIALRELDVAPGEAWFIGDHPFNDVLGASGAGLRAVWLRRLIAWPEGHPGPGATINALGELDALLGYGSSQPEK